MVALDLRFDDEDLDEDPPLPPRVDQMWVDPDLIDWIAKAFVPLWWHRAAACWRDGHFDLVSSTGAPPGTKAKQICAGCPVVAASLDWALEGTVMYGISAG